jgi:hypothetical protein
MTRPLQLAKYSLGVGDRFGQQAKAQLEACRRAAAAGVEVIPVWNKSFREHSIIGSTPRATREAADAAVRQLGWSRPYHVDADHINLDSVQAFLDPCDFFTIDVAEAIGRPAAAAAVEAFLDRHAELIGTLAIDGLDQPFQTTRDAVAAMAGKYLFAVEEAARIYRHIEARKGAGAFIAEISMDETDAPQTPPELLVILAAVADAGIPIQTIAPKFTGRFNKGVDYAGDVSRFAREFEQDLAVVAHAARRYGLPPNLKLSVHSGSDKFSLYGPIHRALERFDAGVHLKTAGTTWLEELIGLAEAGPEGLALAQEIYAEAYAHREELCAPYAAVIDIDPEALPPPGAVRGWTSEQFAAALRHDPHCPRFNPHFRQLLHVGYKVAAGMGARYLEMLAACETAIARNVTANLFERHIRPLFLGATD